MGTPQVDPAVAVAELEGDYPGIQIWYGSYTRRYKALIAGQLIETPTAGQLAQKLKEMTQTRRTP